MAPLNVRLFGTFRIQCGAYIWEGHDICKLQELLCYLLIHRSAQHQREQLASLFWGESSTAQSKKYLRQVLWQLQHACDARLGLSSDRLITVHPDWIQINPELDLWADVLSFETAYAQLRLGEELGPEVAQSLKTAVQLYQGDLLEGCYQDWCLYERERLQNMFLTMLDKLIVYCEAHQAYEAGLTYGGRLLQRDPARERTHQQMMRLHYLAGDRTAALRQFEQCAEALRKELGVSPTKKTLTLHEQIRTDQLEAPLASAHPWPLVPEAPTSLPALLTHLKQLQAALSALQQQLQQDIKLVEHHLPASRDRG